MNSVEYQFHAEKLVTISRPIAFLYPFLPAQWQLGFVVQIPSCLLLFIGSIPAAMAILKVPGEERQSTQSEEVGSSRGTVS